MKVHEYRNVSNLHFRISMRDDFCPVFHGAIILVNIFYEIRFRAVTFSFVINSCTLYKFEGN